MKPINFKIFACGATYVSSSNLQAIFTTKIKLNFKNRASYAIIISYIGLCHSCKILHEPSLRIADCFGCSKVLKNAESVVTKNMSNKILIEAWSYGTTFRKTCLEFVEKSNNFDTNQLLNDIGKLSLDDLNELIKCVKSFGAEDLVKLQLKWIIDQTDFHDYGKMISKLDFTKINEKDRFNFYFRIINKLDRVMSKTELNECRDHIFKSVDFSAHSFKLTRIKEQRFHFEYDYAEEELRTISLNDHDYPERHTLKGHKDSRIYSQKIPSTVETASLKFKITYDGGLGIGIANIDKPETIWKGFLWDPNEAEVYIDGNYEFDEDDHKYGEQYDKMTNEVIEIRFHQAKKELEFFINNKSQGIPKPFTNLPDAEYEFTVYNDSGSDVMVEVL